MKLFLIILLTLGPVAFAVQVNDSEPVDGSEESGRSDRGGSSRVYGGHPIPITDAPWMAFIKYNERGNSYTYCGGTIINNMFVLTAAHCVYTRVGNTGRRINQASEYKVLIGSATRDQGTVYFVSTLIGHPNYDFIERNHDVALLRLNRRITYVRGRVANANLDGREYSAGTSVSSMGWGKNPSNMNTPQLYAVDLSIADTTSCARRYGHSPQDYRQHKICIVGRNNADVCKGDSGGPLMVGRSNQQIGVVSYGAECPQGQRPPLPGVFAKIRDNIRWINNEISGFKDGGDEEGEDEEPDC